MEEVDIYTDGACSGNPGPGGWGAILRSGAHEKEKIAEWLKARTGAKQLRLITE